MADQDGSKKGLWVLLAAGVVAVLAIFGTNWVTKARDAADKVSSAAGAAVDKARDVAGNVDNMASTTADKAKTAAAGVTDTAAGLAEGAASQARNAADKAQSAGVAALRGAKGAAEDVVDSAKGAAAGAADEAKGLARGAVAKAKGAVQGAQNAAGELANSAADSVTGAADYVKGAVGHAAEHAATAGKKAASFAKMAKLSPEEQKTRCKQLATELSQANITFRKGSFNLNQKRASAVVSALNEITTFCPTASVEVVGHTDSFGQASMNRRLSERRAEAFIDYLIGQDIPRQHLSAVGLGETQPAADSTTAAGRAENRRIELRVRVN